MNYCIVCKKEMGSELVSSILKIGTPVKLICSVECVNKNYAAELGIVLCCEKAIRKNCFCMISFDCETHGRKCIGTHD